LLQRKQHWKQDYSGNPKAVPLVTRLIPEDAIPVTGRQYLRRSAGRSDRVFSSISWRFEAFDIPNFDDFATHGGTATDLDRRISEA